MNTASPFLRSALNDFDPARRDHALHEYAAQAGTLSKTGAGQLALIAGLERLPPELLSALRRHPVALLGLNPERWAEREVLRRLDVEFDEPWQGCCGMAGSFGFEAEHYGVSQTIAEQALLPAVREAAPDALVIVQGFSCHTQIADGSGRQPIHLAQALERALSRQAATAGTAGGKVPRLAAS